MKWSAVAIVLALGLTSCTKFAMPVGDYTDPATKADMVKPGPAPLPPAAGQPMLAYEYDYGLTVPAGSLRALMAGHERACRDAGPAVCQLTASSIRESDNSQVFGRIELRATPQWLAPFRNDLAGSAKAAGGRITSTEVSTEDLTRDIVDGDARLRAQAVLRDRLQALLASRPGKLSDLLDVERELARVQGGIDAAQSELTVMKARVATSKLVIDYSSKPRVASRGAFSPLARAGGDFIGILMQTLAAMIRFVAWTAPWILVAALFWKLFGHRLPKWRRRAVLAEPKADG